MKAITIRQPWASLIAEGVKTIEARPRRTRYRGRIAIHAGKTEWWPQGGRVGDWRLYRSTSHAEDERRAGRAFDGLGNRHDLPLGAVVASAVLTDCVPNVGEDEDLDRDSLDYACIEHRPADANNAGLWLWPAEDEGEDMAEPADVTRQLPFGDFRPGRWALLLADIKPTTERCPWCWGDPEFGSIYQRLSTCAVCHGAYRCDPVPARGQQAVPWQWTP